MICQLSMEILFNMTFNYFYTLSNETLINMTYDFNYFNKNPKG